MDMMTPRRKLMIATWDSPREGNIFGRLTVDAHEALAYVQHVRDTTGEKVSVTHLVGRALGAALAQAPGLNGYIRFGRYIPHDRVDLAYLVALEGGADLAKAKIENIDKKSLADIGRELRERAQKLRGGRDPDFEKSKGTLRMFPTWILKPLVNLTGWLTASLGLNMPMFGLERFPFGSCVVTSVGMFGLDEGFAPFTPFARVPLLVLVGSVHDEVVPWNGVPTIRKRFTINATIDHRFIDGAQIAVLAKVIKSILEDPWQLEGGRPALTSAASAPAAT
jgi:pyruvate dehydrogenase E2 component (dihydrolipoamide acetyltransferase)